MSAVLREFELDSSTTFILEVGDQYLRFFANREAVTSGASIYELTTPYALADVPSLRFRQINDTIRITHPSYEPRILTRVADANWTLTTADYFSGPDALSFPPFLDQNITSTTIAASALTGPTTLTASAAIFQAGHVGSYWKIVHTRPGESQAVAISGLNTSPEVFVFGSWVVTTTGTWSATLLLERSLDGATWETVRTWTRAGSPNVSETGEGLAPGFSHRLRVSAFTSGTAAFATLEAQESDVNGFVLITAFTNSTHVDGTVQRVIQSTDATKRWSEGAWSAVRGYPTACEFHDGRLVFGGTDYEPRTVRGSCVDDFNNFESGTDDNLAYAWTIGGRRHDRITWILSQSDLLIGTTGSITRMRGDANGNPITPTRADFKTRVGIGCANLPAILTESAVMFVERKSRKLRGLSFDNDSQNYVVEDLSLLSEHLLRSGIVEMAWQADAQTVWCVTGVGDLIGFTYNPLQDVKAWHRHDTDGIVESVACISGDDDANDEVYFIIARPIGAQTVRFVESFDPTIWERKEEYFGVDCGLSYNGSPVFSVSGLDHLIGMYVDALVDGIVHQQLLVDDTGTITLPSGSDPGEVWHVGLPYIAEVEPFRLDADPRLGVHLGKMKKVTGLLARFSDSVGMQFETELHSHTVELPKEAGADVINNPPLFNGDLKIDYNSGNTREPRVIFRQKLPLPFSLVALIPSYDVSTP